MGIITLTLNPAFDIHCYTENFKPLHENLARVTSRDAGGKGINISRALWAADCDSLALVTLGEENRGDFEKALGASGVKYKAVAVEGRIRENITIHTANTAETRISFAGFSADDSLIDRYESLLDGENMKNTVLTVTGRNPSGVTVERVKTLLKKLKDRGAKIVIDSKSFTLNDIIDVSPFLIKPNEEEIGEYLGRPLEGVDDAVDFALDMRAKSVENVMVSLGAKGAVLVSADGAFLAVPPRINAVSTIGAGDSSVAGFIFAAERTESASERLRYAVAFGTAACLTEGTLPPRKEDIEKILSMVTLEKIK